MSLFYLPMVQKLLAAEITKRFREQRERNP
jgi:hypothetical protein